MQVLLLRKLEMFSMYGALFTSCAKFNHMCFLTALFALDGSRWRSAYCSWSTSGVKNESRRVHTYRISWVSFNVIPELYLMADVIPSHREAIKDNKFDAALKSRGGEKPSTNMTSMVAPREKSSRVDDGVDKWTRGIISVSQLSPKKRGWRMTVIALTHLFSSKETFDFRQGLEKRVNIFQSRSCWRFSGNLSAPNLQVRHHFRDDCVGALLNLHLFSFWSLAQRRVSVTFDEIDVKGSFDILIATYAKFEYQARIQSSTFEAEKCAFDGRILLSSDKKAHVEPFSVTTATTSG